jgi:hypothetical protein
MKAAKTAAKEQTGLALLLLAVIALVIVVIFIFTGNPGQLVSSIRIVVGEISSYVRIVRVFKQSRPIRESW